MVFFLVSHKTQKTRTIRKVICDDTFNHPIPGNIYLFKVSKRNAKKKVRNMLQVNNKDTRKLQ